MLSNLETSEELHESGDDYEDNLTLISFTTYGNELKENSLDNKK